MVTTLSRTSNETRRDDQQQTLSEWTATTQMMVLKPQIAQEVGVEQPTISSPSIREGVRKPTGIVARIGQAYWRVSFEIEPLLANLFSPFTAPFHRSRLLSSREQAELKAHLMKR